MPQYPNNMHTSPNRPSPRGVDERNRRSTYYDENMFDGTPDGHGSQGSLARNTAVAQEVPISQPHYQQRIVPVEQTRPPPANNAPLDRGPANGSRPPSYGNSSYEEALITKTDPAEQRQQQQQQRRRGYRRTDELGQEPEQIPAPIQQQQQQLVNNRTRPTPAVRTGSLQNQNQSPPNVNTRAPNQSPKRAQEPQSPQSSSPIRQEPVRPENNNLKAGNSIPRLNSPSVSQVVLQPLDAKVQEYGNQMLAEEKLMAQLDSEMAALQERRRAADNRFMAAKTKHDDYRRQYLGVERALRGEPNQPISRSPRSSFDEDEERPMTQQTARPPHTPGGTSRTESWGSVQKPKSGRFRMSKIFGAV